MQQRTAYDQNWKEIVTHLTAEFIEFFFPELFALIDFSIEFEFLEQEFYTILEQADEKDKGKHKKRYTDKLVKVYLKNGEIEYIFVHIEFQGDKGQDIAVRMYRYYRRIEEKLNKNITAIVIYTSANVPKVNNCYKNEHFGTEISYKFNTYQIRKQSETELLKSSNPFALVVLANLYVIQTKQDDPQRLIFKKKLYELAFAANYSEAQSVWNSFVSSLI